MAQTIALEGIISCSVFHFHEDGFIFRFHELRPSYAVATIKAGTTSKRCRATWDIPPPPLLWISTAMLLHRWKRKVRIGWSSLSRTFPNSLIRENVRKTTGEKHRKKSSKPCGSKDFSMEATPGFEPGNQGFADPCLTTWLCRHIRNQEQKDLAPDSLLWSGRRGSNPLPPPWQGGALPDELRPHGCADLIDLHILV